MHLTSLKLRGFKSFATTTTLEFCPGINAVVGPNGAGKSNIVDALGWVMGEQSTKSLRAGAMQDVIFAGNSQRAALGRAKVSAAFDVSTADLDLDADELTVSRTMFRAGGSEYELNGQPAKLTEVQELLTSVGFGKLQHSVVNQGHIDRVLHASAVERRHLIEEAVGITSYRLKADKTERKLTSLKANLDRLEDLANELRQQLEPLKHQSHQAMSAQELNEQIRQLKSDLLAEEIGRVRDTHAELAQQLARVADQRQQAATDRETTAQRLRDLAEKMQRNEQELAELMERHFALRQLSARLTAVVAVSRERLVTPTPASTVAGEPDQEQNFHQPYPLKPHTANEELAGARARLDQTEAALERAREEVKKAQAQVNGSDRGVDQASVENEEARAKLENAEATLEKSTAQREQRATEYQQALESAHHGQLTLQTATERVRLLKDALESAIAQQPSATVRREAQLTSWMDGLHIADGWETAISVALSDFSQAWVTPAPLDVPVSHLYEPTSRREVEEPLSSAKLPKGFHLACSLITCAPAVTAVVEHQLRYTLVVDPDVPTTEIRSLLDQYPEASVITTTGVRYVHGATLYLGETATPLYTRTQLTRAQQELTTAEDRQRELKKRQDKTAERLDEARNAEKDAARRLGTARARHTQTTTALAHAQAATEAAAKNLKWLQKAEREALTRRDDAQTAWDAALVKARHQEAQRTHIVSRSRSVINRAEALERYLEAERTTIEETRQTLREEQRDMAATRQDLESKLTALAHQGEKISVQDASIKAEFSQTQTNLDNLAETAREQFERTPEDLEAEFVNRWGEGEDCSFSASGARADLRSADESLRALGAVNPLAVAECEAQQQRFDYLTEQIADLKQTRSSLRSLVRDLHRRMRAEFNTAFEIVKEHFERDIEELFPGGEGTLSLTEDAEDLDAGVDIQVRPAGKKVKRLSLLSGGERSLASLALLTAIFSARPAPCYVLDEVEASLDDRNLARVLPVLRRLGEKSQLIIITHRPATMEIADRLLGVTLQSGQSQALSEDAERIRQLL
ncbi:AAA family ATPase [Rothia sp. LK2588]|uniref:chromosome segregation SMC family protein n=1 Tax=Rothia sp. LK2588 TaxID=3114369 RepID=UPI0034CE3565